LSRIGRIPSYGCGAVATSHQPLMLDQIFLSEDENRDKLFQFFCIAITSFDLVQVPQDASHPIFALLSETWSN